MNTALIIDPETRRVEILVGLTEMSTVVFEERMTSNELGFRCWWSV